MQHLIKLCHIKTDHVFLIDSDHFLYQFLKIHLSIAFLMILKRFLLPTLPSLFQTRPFNCYIFQVIQKGMRKFFKINEEYQTLKSLGMLDNSYQKLGLKQIKQHCRTLVQLDNGMSKITQMLKILEKQNKNSQLSLKMLFFINFIIRDSLKMKRKQIEEIAQRYLMNILQKDRNRLDQIKRSNSKPKQMVVKAVTWVKQRLTNRSYNCDSQFQNTNRSSKSEYQNSFISKNRLNTEQSTRQGITFRTEPETQNLRLGKQELLIQKVIIPYSTYLLKLAPSLLIIQQNKNGDLRTEQIWKILNLLKYILNIGEVIPTMCRYYYNQYLSLILAMVKVIDYEVKVSYPIILKTIHLKFQSIKLQYNEINSNIDLTGRRRAQMLEALASKYSIAQFKQILKQLSLLNQLVSNIYLCKYTGEGIIKMGLKMPVLFGEQYQSDLQLACSILNKIQKSKSLQKKIQQQLTFRGTKMEQKTQIRKKILANNKKTESIRVNLQEQVQSILNANKMNNSDSKQKDNQIKNFNKTEEIFIPEFKRLKLKVINQGASPGYQRSMRNKLKQLLS